MDIAANLGQQRLAGERRRHRHVWDQIADTPRRESYPELACRCGVIRDRAKSRAGTSARRLGHDQERRIERVYGPRKVGEFGDAIDLLGRDFMWQSKATRGEVPLWARIVTDIMPIAPHRWITDPVKAMLALRQDKNPVLIRAWVSQGIPTIDRVIVYWGDWWRLHDELVAHPSQFVVMTGAHFLDVHGRDE
jgi:hypothetical protein